MMQKRQPYRNQKILDSAKGEECTLQVPGVCNGNPETTVAAHSNFGEDGKGMGQKADDCFAVYACSACHDWLDGRSISSSIHALGYIERRDYFHRALKKTWSRLLDKGILK